MSRLLIKNAKALVGTHDPAIRIITGRQMTELPLIENGWLHAENGIITAIGSMETFPGITDWNDLKVIDATGRYVLPGWCDPHTHVVFAAPREGEFVDRITGLTYQEIAAKGGGILNSARRLREMDEEILFLSARSRLHEMMQQGTVAVEIKSGYGLSYESELMMLRVIKRLKNELPVQIRSTLLAAHALPPEFKEDRKGYLDMICDRLIPQVASEGLADHVDVFCETNYFSVAEMERVLETGAGYGLPGKVHVNQFTSIGGIQAAIKHGALSVDHLEVMEPKDIDDLAKAWDLTDPLQPSAISHQRSAFRAPIPTLLPSCSFFLRIPYAPARQLMAANVPVALASDHNPGSTPSGNLNFVLSLACIQLHMLPEEAINAITINSAAAMRVSDELGSIAPGRRASLIITKEIPSLAYLPYAFGSDNIDTVFIDGEPIRSGSVLES
jgi:imidazolonepropionase